MHSCCHVSDVNCVPLSEVNVAGTPNLDTQSEKKAEVQVAADMSFRGTASSHLVVQSIMVKM